MNSNELLQQLIQQTENIIEKAEKLKETQADNLKWRNNPNSWNILEILEHLNHYADFYLPQIEKKIQLSKSKPDPVFRSGIIGEISAKSMLPKAKLKRMKTAADKNPINQSLEVDTIAKFIERQRFLITLLEQSAEVNLNKIKISTTISRFLRLNLGDTYQFLINHQIRHFVQVDSTLKASNSGHK